MRRSVLEGVGSQGSCWLSALPCAWSAVPWLQAYGAIEAYGVHLVVANELHSRKDRVWLVSQQVRGCLFVTLAGCLRGSLAVVRCQT